MNVPMNIPVPVVSRSPITVFDPPAIRHALAGPRYVSRTDWIWICATRLGELRPEQSVECVAFVARDLWADVATFDPAIAAEMEYEAWRAGDRDAEGAEPGSLPTGQTM
jgi:hypothetical protein